MDVRELQSKLGVKPDGFFGPISKGALVSAFTNPAANAITDAELLAFATRLGCTLKQLRAVSLVESSGGGFDRYGRPKILFERHLFHRLTFGRWTPAPHSDARSGGYAADSWQKLLDACACNPDAAFSACSWGKFQVLGMHWQALNYPSPYALAWSTAQSEGDHYELLARFIEANGLKDELRAISADPDACRAFARRFNGPAYERYDYHNKLARAVA